MLIANGITGIRDMGGQLAVIKKSKSEISHDSMVGPRIMAAGPILYGSSAASPTHIAVPSAEIATHIVDSLKRTGADFIKVYSFIPRQCYYAIVKETQKLKMQLVGHVPLTVSLIEAADAGQTSIEHFDFPYFVQECARDFARFRNNDLAREYQLTRPFDTASTPAWIAQIHELDSALLQFDQTKADSIYRHFAKNHTWQCPTFISLKMFLKMRDTSLMQHPLMKYAYSQWIRQDWNYKKRSLLSAMTDEEWNILGRLYLKNLEIAGDMKKRGIRFLAGSDVNTPFIYPGFSLHKELELFVQTGFTPLEALQTATINPAVFFRMEDSLGTVNEGKYADLIILNANPLDDIANTQRIDAVIVRGKYYGRKDLDSLLESVAAKK